MSIEGRAKKILATELGIHVDEVRRTSNLQNDLGVDSLDVVEIIMAMETEFKIEIPDNAITFDKDSRVNAIISYLESRAEELR